VIQVSAAPGSAVLRVSEADVPAVDPRADHRSVQSLLQSRPSGRMVTSLAELAGSITLPAVVGVRRTLARLDAADYEIDVDVREVAPGTPFEITWTPVTALVDLMLDWDLPELEIAVAELVEWLDVDVSVACRALDRLSRYAGVTVEARCDDGVLVRVDLDACPLTSARCYLPELG
jgi:hypothetical protein